MGALHSKIVVFFFAEGGKGGSSCVPRATLSCLLPPLPPLPPQHACAQLKSGNISVLVNKALSIGKFRTVAARVHSSTYSEVVGSAVVVGMIRKPPGDARVTSPGGALPRGLHRPSSGGVTWSSGFNLCGGNFHLNRSSRPSSARQVSFSSWPRPTHPCNTAPELLIPTACTHVGCCPLLTALRSVLRCSQFC